MVVGMMQLELRIEWSQSLKDKRRVVSSLKDRLHRHHQVSVAEVGSQDNLRIAILGIALVTNDVRYGQSVFDHILNQLRSARDCLLTDHSIQFLTGQ